MSEMIQVPKGAQRRDELNQDWNRKSAWCFSESNLLPCQWCSGVGTAVKPFLFSSNCQYVILQCLQLFQLFTTANHKHFFPLKIQFWNPNPICTLTKKRRVERVPSYFLRQTQHLPRGVIITVRKPFVFSTQFELSRFLSEKLLSYVILW